MVNKHLNDPCKDCDCIYVGETSRTGIQSLQEQQGYF